MTERRILIFGATGTLGQALLRETERRGLTGLAVARRHLPLGCDIADPDHIREIWREADPHVVINAAALTDPVACESDPARAYAVNAHAPAVMARLANRSGAFFVQLSPSYPRAGEGLRPQSESEPVLPRTVYTASKYAGEHLARTATRALVVRTAFEGFRGWPDRPTFAEWCLDRVLANRHTTLLTDYFTSALDAPSLARILFDLVDLEVTGLINVASRSVYSRADFIQSLAAVLGRPLSHARLASCKEMPGYGANSAGLDVSLAEATLDYALPDLTEVTRAIARQAAGLYPEIFSAQRGTQPALENGWAPPQAA